MGSRAGFETRLGVQCVRLTVQTDHIAKRSVMITDPDKKELSLSQSTLLLLTRQLKVL